MIDIVHPPRRINHERAFPYWLILPTCIGVLLVDLYPFASAVVLSLQNRIQGQPEIYFVGLSNYGTVLSDDAFWRSLGITLRWTICSVTGQVILGTALALLIHGLRRGQKVVTSLLLVPWVTPLVVAALACRWILHADFGILNALVSPDWLGLPANHDWLGDDRTMLASVVLAHIWKYYGFVMLIVLARLKSIPDGLIDAARIDGGGRWAVFRHVTLPQIWDVLSVTILLMCIWTFNTFDFVYLMAGGSSATNVLAIEVWRRFFGSWNYGLAAATAVLMLSILAMLTLAYMRRVRW